MEYRLILGDVFSSTYPSPPKKVNNQTPRNQTQKSFYRNLDFIPMRNGRKKQMCKKCYGMRIPRPILWRTKSKQVRKAAFPELQCKLLTDGGLKK